MGEKGLRIFSRKQLRLETKTMSNGRRSHSSSSTFRTRRGSPRSRCFGDRLNESRVKSPPYRLGSTEMGNENMEYPPGCPPFHCGKFDQLRFPFSNTTLKECGPFIVDGCSQSVQRIQLARGSGKWFEFLRISVDDGNITIMIRDMELKQRLNSHSCETFNNFSLPPTSSFLKLELGRTLAILKCQRVHNGIPPLTDFNFTKCDEYDIYFNRPYKSLPVPPPHCSFIQLPAAEKTVNSESDPFQVIAAQFHLRVDILNNCLGCLFNQGGLCKNDSKGEFQCAGTGHKGAAGKRKKEVWKLRTAIGCSAIGVIIICSILILFCYRQKYAFSKFISATGSSDPSSMSNIERDSAYFGIPVFTYSELEKATNFFDSTKELGAGGFGTVYHGKLRDGREVAVKRLYENNYKRVEQFVNEIKILTRLRHQNLVSLYGCTSRHSRELLLVYEYIPNGTVADHLHDDRRTPRSLTWPVRLRIAVETASALAYLHASGIIHRDVKTNNILLDSNFCVKVADFGISRLFPTDVTHISTAPQGTPGYVDPEYHRCYQLTEKSDVFSFGVVLVELISSMPAVDLCRERDEINLASFALNRIQNGALVRLVDPCLGFESDCEVRRMVILVAELAFQCLQPDGEMRPSMDEVVRILRSIQGEVDDDDDEMAEGEDKARALESEDIMPSKRMRSLTLPASVADKWVSRTTTRNLSA